MIDTTKFIQTTWQITWHKLSNNTQRLLSHYCFSFLFVSFPFFFFFFFCFLFFFFFMQMMFFWIYSDLLKKVSLEKRCGQFCLRHGFRSFIVCCKTFICTYTKTTICLIGSLYFSEFYGNSISLERRPVVTLLKTLI